MLVHTTLTGQLGLFMLLEQLHQNTIHVLSANTDGINVRVHKSQRKWVDDLVDWWCNQTGFVMDYNHYASISYRDVNNYFYIHKDGYTKGIGIFAGDGIRKSPENSIVRDAIFARVKDGVPIEDTIINSTDPFAFLTLRKATGGGMKDGEPIGNTIRWYHSLTSKTPIVSCKPNASGTHNQVAGSSCGVPLMNVTPNVMPADIDYAWYINQAYVSVAHIGLVDVSVEHARDLGCNDWAEYLQEIGVTKQDIRKYKIRTDVVI